jgi:hypothetical protein
LVEPSGSAVDTAPTAIDIVLFGGRPFRIQISADTACAAWRALRGARDAARLRCVAGAARCSLDSVYARKLYDIDCLCARARGGRDK